MPCVECIFAPLDGYYDDVTGKSYFGTVAGKIFELGTLYADVDGATVTPINMEVIPHPNNWGFPESRKNFGKISATGRLQSNMLAASSYEALYSNSQSGNMVDGLVTIAVSVEARELWLAFNESYNDTPPFLKEIIIDQVEVYDDAN